MKIAIMQPYFFPFLGYFGLIKNTDRWIVFDTPQFIRQGWMDRNRILKPKEGWQYIRVPLKKHSRDTATKDIEIRNDENWVETIFAKLTLYKNVAPYYDETIELLNGIFSEKFDSLTELNCHITGKICEFTGIEWNYSVFSKMDLKIEEVKAPDEWALNICKSIGNIDEYWNPPGGIDFFDRSKYENSKIGLKFYNQILRPYNQKRNVFESGLSIIDVLMFNSTAQIKKMLNEYEIL